MNPSLAEVKRIVALQLGVRDVGDHDRFLEDLGAESADVMNIIATVEEKYEVVIKESEIQDLQTPMALFARVSKD